MMHESYMDSLAPFKSFRSHKSVADPYFYFCFPLLNK